MTKGAFARNKGKSGEREIVAFIQGAMTQVEYELGIADKDRLSNRVQRNLNQSIAGGDDLVNVPWHSVEVKNCAVLALDAWWLQCTTQAQAVSLRPLLVYKVGRSWRCRTWMHTGNDVVQGQTCQRWIACDMDFLAYLPHFKDIVAAQYRHAIDYGKIAKQTA